MIYQTEQLLRQWEDEVSITRGKIDQLISMYEQENLLESHGAIMLSQVSLAYNSKGRETLAIKYALRAIDQGLLQFGSKSYYVQEMDHLLKSPQGHWSWAQRVHY
jgi:hypothetical protein